MSGWIQGARLLNWSLTKFQRVVGKAMQSKGSIVPFSLMVILKRCMWSSGSPLQSYLSSDDILNFGREVMIMQLATS